MRRFALLLPLLLLAACEKEPKFEERYEKAAGEIETRARSMDADIAAAEETAAAADEALPSATRPATPPASSGE